MATTHHTFVLTGLALLLAGCVSNPQVPASAGTLMGSLMAPSTGTAATPMAAATPAGGGNLIELLAQSVQNISEPQEIEIGRQLSAILLGSKPLYKDAALQAYVNNLGRWISLQSSRPNLPWTFMVLDDAGFNAFAAPGGYVFVTKGLIDAARNEAELAGVLAHEITHVVEKHHLKSLNKTAQAALAGQVLASQVRSGIGSFVASQLLGMGKELYSKGLDRDDEYEADRKGIALATRAGLDPFGLPALLQTLASAKPDNPHYSLVLATHPPTQQRISSIEAAMGDRFDTFAAARPVPISARLRNVAAQPVPKAAATAASPPRANTPAKPAPKPPAKP